MNDQLMSRCNALLIAIVGIDAAYKWWESRNKAFDMQTPDEVWKTEPEKVYGYLLHHTQK